MKFTKVCFWQYTCCLDAALVKEVLNAKETSFGHKKDGEMLPDGEDRLPAKSCCFGRKLPRWGGNLWGASPNSNLFIKEYFET